MSAIITIIHVFICFILIVAVLLQSGKAADLAGAFGGVGSQTAFGPRGAATLLSKVTTVCAVLFMVTSLGLWILSGQGAKSVVKGEEAAKPAAPLTTTETKKEETATPATPSPKEEAAKPGNQAEKKKAETEKNESPLRKNLN